MHCAIIPPNKVDRPGNKKRIKTGKVDTLLMEEASRNARCTSKTSNRKASPLGRMEEASRNARCTSNHFQ
jgi:hypothetical protein